MRRNRRKKLPYNKKSTSRKKKEVQRRRWKLPFNPHSEATGRFIVSIFRKDMHQARRDVVDIIGELLDKR